MAQRPNPLVSAVAARGVSLNRGDFDGGLAVVDRAVVDAEAALSGPEKAFATGTLHLRGMTLAGRFNEKAEGRSVPVTSTRRCWPGGGSW